MEGWWLLLLIMVKFYEHTKLSRYYAICLVLEFSGACINLTTSTTTFSAGSGVRASWPVAC